MFFLIQYLVGLARLGSSSGAMENKFSALARDEYMGFLVWQNVQVLIAYVLLALLFAIVLQPFCSAICLRYGIGKARWRVTVVLAGAFLIHGYFILRLVDTRPYFLGDAKFGHWYYEVLNVVPEVVKPAVFFFLFKALPLAVAAYVVWWHWAGLSRRGRIAAPAVVAVLLALFVWKSGFMAAAGKAPVAEKDEVPNVIIIGSDSLRADKLGCNGYVPRRGDGLAAGGVSPRIDALASRSANFTGCYTPIASTLESGTSLMVSQYPHTHGLRHMYPDEETVAATKARISPIAPILAAKGYDTAAFGDWCAGYYELMPMGFGHISVSSFDNFKIYMSQAVVMAHFVIPLYFDHPLGYAVFPQLGSFASFVTPEVVTERVKGRLEQVAESGKPFFWHVFYSCNHLPYRSPEPYSTMFADPGYAGPNKSGVDFDIDSFIGGTDLENKWKALPEKEIRQIRDLYDGCTRQFDDNVGQILDALKSKGLDENTIVIVTADHGDNLYEEGVTLGHGLTFGGGMGGNHVPLVFHIPGAQPQEIPATVSIIDIVPTIADLLGAEKPASWEGKSFAKWLDGTEPPSSRAYYGETGFPFVQFRVPGVTRPKLPPMDGMTFIDDSFNYQFVLKKEWQEPLVAAKQRCLMTDDWQLICTPAANGSRHFALFERSGGDFGIEDVSAENPEIHAAMKAALEKWMDTKTETPAEDVFRAWRRD
ncbi:sulfatase-like hydrolase/transferase [Akkermansiaceae bacterium]|nr:sulfatase-like hydrolase/transferase [Akkermansiaceae bacterium]